MQGKQVRLEYAGLTSPGLLKLCPFGLPETDMLAGVIQVPGADHSSKVSGTTPFSNQYVFIVWPHHKASEREKIGDQG